MRFSVSRFSAKAGLAVVGVVALLAAGTPAEAVNTAQGNLVTAVPSTATPNLNNGAVLAIAQVGTRIVIGGSFTSASPQNSTTTYARPHILAFNAQTGAVDQGFAPNLDGTVENLTPGPSPDTVYAGGYFNNVNGQKAKGVALLSTVTGAMVGGFQPAALNGVVYGVRLSGGHLFIGGSFTKAGGATHQGLATLDPLTGKLDPFMNVQLTGHHNYTGQTGQSNGSVGPRKLDISPDGSRMVAIGNFKDADNQLRDQIVMIDLSGGTATLDPNWATAAYSATCFSFAFDTYMSDVDFSPDGSYFAVGATGGSGTNTDGTNSSCDSVARFETAATGADVRPTWLDYTGQDTIGSVAVTGTAIYAGGHQRWLNNENGHDNPGQGAVPRPGLAALDPSNGLPFSWNPGRNPRGVGAYALLATQDGLYVGSDTQYIGNHKYLRKRLAFFPLAGGEAVTPPTTPQLPANVYLAGQLPSTANSNVLYRVDTGGPALQATDNGPDWQADQTDSDPGAAYRNTGSNSAQWSPSATRGSALPANAPTALFDSERWDPGSTNDGGELAYHFAVTAGTPLQVRLFFANRCSCTSAVGARQFDVSLDGTQVLSSYDIVADVGDQTGTMKQFDVTAPTNGQVDIGLGHEVENPLINGIEIDRTDVGPGTGGNLDTLQYRHYDGSTVGPTIPVNNTGNIAWSQTRGAFMIGSTLFYGSTDGNLYKRSFDGSTFGAATLVDPYDDPVWSNVQTGSGQTYRGTKPDLYGQFPNVTGMFYSAGYLYYTLYGQSSLYARAFTPESGIIGSHVFTTSGDDSVSNATGMFRSGNEVYYASRSDGTLHRADFANGTLDGASDTVVSGPAQDGNDWRARALFLNPGAPAQNPPPTAAISFAGSASTNGNAVTESVPVPSGVRAGDGMVLLASSSTSSAPVDPAGWALVRSVTNGSTLTTTVWQRVATAADVGSSVSVTRSGNHKASLQLVAYHGTDGTRPVSQTGQASDTTSSTSHTTPTVTGVATGSWVISYWADKGSGPNTWAAPNGPTVRDTSYGSGAGQVSALITDEGPVGSGSYGGLTATTDPSVPRAQQWTIVLAPAA